MTTNRSLASRLPLLTLALLAAPTASHAQYIVFDLGVLSGGTSSRAYGINNNGFITGSASTSAAANNHAFIADGNATNPALTDLGVVSGSTISNGYAINNSNVVTGNSGATSTALAPFYNDGSNHALPPSTGTTGTLRAINDSGLAVGFSNSGATAVTYQVGGGATTLTSLATAFPAGTNVSQALGVNNNGQIAGYYGTAFVNAANPATNQVYRYNADGTLLSLGTLGGVTASGDGNSGGFGINNSGYIAGSAKTSTGALHSFLYDGSVDAVTGRQLHDLGTLVPGAVNSNSANSAISEAYSINSIGDVVGGSNYASPASPSLANFHAYIYTHGSAFYNPTTGLSSLVDLNTLTNNLTAGGFSSLNIAYGINDNGWIVGVGTTTGGQSHAFLLRPAPAPSSLLVAGFGIFGVGLRLRRRARK